MNLAIVGRDGGKSAKLGSGLEGLSTLAKRVGGVAQQPGFGSQKAKVILSEYP